MKEPTVFDLDAELTRLKANAYPPLATPDQIDELETALGHPMDPIHRNCLLRYGRAYVDSDVTSLTRPEWGTADLGVGDVEDAMFWVEELPTQYELHGYTYLGSDLTGMPVIYGPSPDPTVYFFDRFTGPPAVLERIGDNIEHTLQRLQPRPPHS